MASGTQNTPPSGGSGGDGGVQTALDNFKKASEEASAKSIKVAEQMTVANGTKGALTKISPG